MGCVCRKAGRRWEVVADDGTVTVHPSKVAAAAHASAYGGKVRER